MANTLSMEDCHHYHDKELRYTNQLLWAQIVLTPILITYPNNLHTICLVKKTIY